MEAQLRDTARASLRGFANRRRNLVRGVRRANSITAPGKSGIEELGARNAERNLRPVTASINLEYRKKEKRKLNSPRKTN